MDSTWITSSACWTPVLWTYCRQTPPDAVALPASCRRQLFARHTTFLCRPTAPRHYMRIHAVRRSLSDISSISTITFASRRCSSKVFLSRSMASSGQIFLVQDSGSSSRKRMRPASAYSNVGRGPDRNHCFHISGDCNVGESLPLDYSGTAQASTNLPLSEYRRAGTRDGTPKGSGRRGPI